MKRVTEEGFTDLQGLHSLKYEVLRKKIIAAKSGNILPYFKANLCVYQSLPLRLVQLLGQLEHISEN